MSNHSDFLERSRLQEQSHLLQHFDATRLEIITLVSKSNRSAITTVRWSPGTLHPDATITPCRSKHLRQFILRLRQPLLRAVCTADHWSQALQNTCHERHGLHGLSRFPTRAT